MKKIIALFLVLASLFLLVGCGDSFYEPVESTELENTTVMTIKLDGRTYEIKYELYRALYLTHKSTVDGGDDSVWSGDEKDKYIEKINAIIEERIADIYGAFAACYRAGLDPYSTAVGKKINEYIKISVEGGTLGGVKYEGYGSYEKYLEKLAELNLNYSVQTLLFRYSIALDMLEEHYIGTISVDDIKNGVISDGDIEYSESVVRAFYNSGECIRILRTYVSENQSTELEDVANRVRSAIAEAAPRGEEAVLDAMIANLSPIAQAELEQGYLMAEHNLARGYYQTMVDAAFALDVGEVTEPIRIHDGNELRYYIIYKCNKTEDYYTNNYAEIAYIYLKNELGKKLNDTYSGILDNISYTDFLKDLEYSGIGARK